MCILQKKKLCAYYLLSIKGTYAVIRLKGSSTEQFEVHFVDITFLRRLNDDAPVYVSILEDTT